MNKENTTAPVAWLLEMLPADLRDIARAYPEKLEECMSEQETRLRGERERSVLRCTAERYTQKVLCSTN